MIRYALALCLALPSAVFAATDAELDALHAAFAHRRIDDHSFRGGGRAIGRPACRHVPKLRCGGVAALS